LLDADFCPHTMSKDFMSPPKYGMTCGLDGSSNGAALACGGWLGESKFFRSCVETAASDCLQWRARCLTADEGVYGGGGHEEGEADEEEEEGEQAEDAGEGGLRTTGQV
jgi:hypothetical protein